MKTLQPPGWAAPKGYANGIAARGRLVFVAGQVGHEAHRRPVRDTIDQYGGQGRTLLDQYIFFDESQRAHLYVVRLPEEQTQTQLVGDLLDRAFGERLSLMVLPVPLPHTRGVQVVPTTNGTALLELALNMALQHMAAYRRRPKQAGRR